MSCLRSLVLMLLHHHQVLQHVEGVSIRLHWHHAVLLGVHLEEAVVVQTHHLGLWSVLTPETNLGPTEVRAQTATVSSASGSGNMTKLEEMIVSQLRPAVRAQRWRLHFIFTAHSSAMKSFSWNPEPILLLWKHQPHQCINVFTTQINSPVNSDYNNASNIKHQR